MSAYQPTELLSQLHTLHAELTDDLSRASNRGEHIQIQMRIDRTERLIAMCEKLSGPVSDG